MTTLTTAPIKEIVYDRETRDYRMLLDGEFVGYAACYHAAEVELDRLAYEQHNRVNLIELELTLSATALDGGSVEEIAAEYAEALVTSEPVCPGIDLPCGRPALYDGLCAWHHNERSHERVSTPATDPSHDIALPDEAECPSTSGPQPCEDLPVCATPDDDDDDDEPADEDDDDWPPDGLDDVLAPSWPESSSGSPCFILPTGTTAQSVILCIGGVSRVVSAQGVAEALTLASVYARLRTVVCPACGRPLPGTTFGLCSACLRAEEAAYYDPERSA